MNIFSLIALLGGLAFFLYGMNVMSAALEKTEGGKLEQTLKTITGNKYRSLLLGAGITIAIQSSSATTVMLVGLVNSGIMELEQTIGVIMGSNIGTTLTAWLLSLTGIESTNLWLNLLKPENFAPIFAFVGIAMRMVSKSQRRKNVGEIFIGFSVLMFGMQLMSDAVSPLADMPEFSSLLTAFNNPILGVLIGAVFTGIIQSSAATIGILQALSITGSITYNMAIPIIMGLNIGTCMTSLLSSIGVNKNAKRVVVIHTAFNIIGTVLCMGIYYGLNAILHFSFTDAPVSTFMIAAIHSIFNIFTTAVLLPFTAKLEKLAFFFVKGSAEEENYSFIDERLFHTPSVALAECANRAFEMASIASSQLFASMRQLEGYEEKHTELIYENENLIDSYEDKLSTALMRISSLDITPLESRQVTMLLHVSSDLERLGDHATNILEIARSMNAKKLDFSQSGLNELKVLSSALTEVINNSVKAFTTSDLDLATKVEPLEEVIDNLVEKIKTNYINRLQKGDAKTEVGFAFMDLLTNYERISDHCSNIAISQIESVQDKFEAHEYLISLKQDPDKNFTGRMEKYAKKYALPEENA